MEKNKEKKDSTFCPVPWIFQAVRNNGDIRVCCQANITKNQGVVRKKDGTSYNAGKDNLLEAKNSDLIKKIRVNMLKGEKSSECFRCYNEEKNGLQSRRQYEIEIWGNHFEKAKKITKKDGTIDSPTIFYDLRFGNFCNLACRMCGPTDSHTWYKQWIDYHETDGYKDTHGYVKLKTNDKGRLYTTDYNWHENDSFWNQLYYNIPDIKRVYMAGGEPLLIEQHYDFLEKCIEKNCSKNIVIEYNTNMTVLPERVLKLWKHFKEVRVGASIDGFGDVLEYQRWPIKWETAYENLKKLDTLCLENKNIISWLAFTITPYNIWHLPQFMLWKLNDSGFKKINSSRKRPIITNHVAHVPKRINITIFPDDVKIDLNKHYNHYANLFKNSNYNDNIKLNAASIFTSVMNYMNQKSEEHYFLEFIKFTKFLDNSRKQNIQNIVPEVLSNYFR